jgi:hypothetical protein
VVEGDPAFETIVRGDLFLDTYPPTGAGDGRGPPLMALRRDCTRSTSSGSARSSGSRPRTTPGTTLAFGSGDAVCSASAA